MGLFIFFPLSLFKFSVVIRLFLAPKQEREREGGREERTGRRSGGGCLEKEPEDGVTVRRVREMGGSWRGQNKGTGREKGQGERRRGRGGGGRLWWHSFLRLFSSGSMMISQLLLLSQNLSCKKDSVKTAAMAARDCVLREN